MTALRIPARTRPWYSDRREVARLAEWLVRVEQYDAEQLLDVIDEPWHYTLERNRMIRHEATEARA